MHTNKKASKKVLAEDTQVTEDQAAQNAASIQPKGKVDAMSMAMTLLASMKGDEINQLLATLQQNSATASASIPDGTAEKNKASIAGKGAVKEELGEIFQGETLDEETKEKLTTLFEAAVNAQLQLELATLEEAMETQINEKTDEITALIIENVDKYMTYVADKWLKDNEVAIESSLRTEIAEQFMLGLKGLFKEHYIEIPDDKLDVVEELGAKVKELEDKLNESLNKNIEFEKLQVEAKKHSVFEQVAEGLAMTQVERFKTLAEGIEFDGDTEKFAKKLNIIKEKHFAKKTDTSAAASVLEESFAGQETETREVPASPEMKAYVAAIKRTVKK